jgi:hypothetical protein
MKHNKLFSIIALLVIASSLLTACQGTSVASCAVLVGDGYPDAVVDAVYYPGQSYSDPGTDHVIRFLPCGDRNYLITDGSKASNGITVGDETTLLQAKTSTGTDVLIGISAYFQLNQSLEAMQAFYAYQYKFGAASNQDVSGGAVNNSTPEWLDMLGETFGPAMDRTVKECTFLTGDSIWQNGDPEQKKVLKECVVTNLKAKLRIPTGYSNVDFFCGANGSEWANPGKPGEGTFSCAPIDIEIDLVKKNPDQSNASTQGSTDLATQRRLVGEELYGKDRAGCVLALIDIVTECNKGTNSCNLVFADDICTSSKSPASDLLYLPVPMNPAEPLPTVSPTVVP